MGMLCKQGHRISSFKWHAECADRTKWCIDKTQGPETHWSRNLRVNHLILSTFWYTLGKISYWICADCAPYDIPKEGLYSGNVRIVHHMTCPRENCMVRLCWFVPYIMPKEDLLFWIHYLYTLFAVSSHNNIHSKVSLLGLCCRYKLYMKSS